MVPGGWTINFCPNMFTDGKLRYINDITDGQMLSAGSISTFNTFEGVIIHEWLHCDIAAGFVRSIIDITGDFDLIAGSAGKIYGATLCHNFAWQWVGRGLPGMVNIRAAWNGKNPIPLSHETSTDDLTNNS